MMGEFIANNIVSVFFGLTTLITSVIALRYVKLEHRRKVERILGEGRRAGLFLSREAMIKYLLSMYDAAKEGDVIWAQCVRCTDFTPAVRSQILKAAGRGVRFQMIINKYSPSVGEFRALFEPIQTAELVEGTDNAISLQGLSEREVVIAFPGVDSYTAVLMRDRYFVLVVKAWFDKQFSQLKEPIGDFPL
ncbi:MAG: hypothetical protein L0332_30870 [Chloroflexi bacterium]|nr:hypothetical protein [Chloroflexota bacterium]MCI0731103.1 hypothetical protein [Chloroflexota bacterium]